MPKFSAYMKGGEGIVGPPGASFISGIVATTSQLPENPPENRQIYLVGESDPKHIYAYVDGVWTDQGLTASEIANVNATIQSIGWTEDPTVQVSFSTENQKDYFNFDFAVPKTRPAGFGTSSDASATTIAFGATPTVSVSASGEDWEKNFHFDFNIPAGEPAGFGTPHVEVEKVPSGTDPIVEVSTVTTSPENAKEFNFHFGIPEGVAAGFSTNQNVSVSTLDAGEQATVEISTVTTSPETEKVFNFHFGLPRGDALAIYDGIPFTANADGYNYHWEDRNGTTTLVFNRGTVEKVPIYIYNNNNESIASTFKLSTSTIEYEADEKFDGTMYLMMPATLQSVEVGSVSSTTYDNQPVVSRSTGSTTTTLILDFVIPEGYPGRNSIDSITTNIESISTKVNNNIIDIENLSTNKVNKTGDTITGPIFYKTSYADISSSTVTQDETGFDICDKNDNAFAYFRGKQSSGEIGAFMCAYGKQDGTDHWNVLRLNVNNDGTRSVYVSVPDAWCTALNAVNKAGDSLTGTLTSSPGSGVSWINGCAGQGAGLYVKKGTLNQSQWIPGITIQTKSGGGWAIGNYNDETLMIVYGTKSNIDSGTNTTNNYYIDTSGNYSGKAANVTGTINIANGGTGATDAINARKNLGYLGMFFAPSVNSAECTIIADNSNLNTAAFTVCKKYVSQVNTNAQSLSNCPTQKAFQMLVFNLLTEDTAALGSTAWQYRTRIIMTFEGNIYIQCVYTNNNKDITYNAWKQITTTTV